MGKENLIFLLKKIINLFIYLYIKNCKDFFEKHFQTKLTKYDHLEYYFTYHNFSQFEQQQKM